MCYSEGRRRLGGILSLEVASEDAEDDGVTAAFQEDQ
jgi:hypothetical protein